MQKALLSELPPFSKIVLTLAAVLVGMFVFMIIGLVVAIPLFDIDIASFGSMSNDMLKDNPAFLKYFQIVTSIGLFVAPPLGIAFLFDKKGFEYLKINFRISPSVLLLVAVAMIFGLPLINYTAEINSYMVFPDFLEPLELWMREKEESATKLTEAFLNVSTWQGLTLNIFMVAVIPAIGEELLFRGLLQRLFSELTRNLHWGIFISAFLFSAIHLQFYGFLPRLLLGMFFGYLLLWSNSIILPIIAHFVNNCMAVIFYFLFNNGYIAQDIDDIGSTQGTLSLVIVSSIIMASLLFLIHKKRPVVQFIEDSQSIEDSLE